MTKHVRLCYVYCPKCKQRIREPFSRLSGPVAYTHRYKPCRARLIVTPDPIGVQHRVQHVSDSVTLEKALSEAIDREVA